MVFNEQRIDNVPVIVIAGYSGAGKTEVSRGLLERNRRLRVYETGQFLRDSIPVSDPINDQLFEFGKKLQAVSPHHIVELMVAQAQQAYMNEEIDGVVISGIRRAGEFFFLWKEYDAHTLFVDAPRHMRLRRINERKRDIGDSITLENLTEMDYKQREELRVVEKLSSSVLYNIGSRKEIRDLGIVSVRSRYSHLT